jgi:hypothetical protein
MKVWGLWYGGSSYATPTTEDAEEFVSFSAAKRAFEWRYKNWGGRTPCVDSTAEMTLFTEKPTDKSYPFRRLYISVRDSVTWERC